ncbi:MAG: DUF721 domain-containing protein [Paludibacteraceae bacterium]|jgi:predicted nucleic acid-binding Zn ribbon protein|nr:DUF721 domain-containing protein [Paludibacteraceae bacterium]MED9995504.1 DUF721 domain-containing protein [Paludibacteraceae bacterium]
MNRQDPIKVADVMDAYFEAMGVKDKIDEARIILAWKQLMGSVIAKKTTQLQVKNGVLYVSLSSPVLRKELLYMREKMVKQLNGVLEREFLTDIVFM